MKKALFVLAFAALMVVAFAPSAFALHGSFAAYGLSCAECHVVHNSSGGNLFVQANQAAINASTPVGVGVADPTKSLQWTGGTYVNNSTEALCEYCHVYGGHAIQQVYGAGLTASSNTMGIHEIGATTIPDSGSGAWALKGDGAGKLGCVDCHNALPHAGKAFTAVKIDSPTKAAQSIYAQDANVNAFCSRCHNSNMAVSLGGTSHILTSAAAGTLIMSTTGFGNQQVAWTNTATCLSCHGAKEFHNLAAQPGTQPGVLINGASSAGPPASGYATGTAFTNYGGGGGYGATNYSIDEVADGMCLSCHQSGTGSGVGLTY